MNKEKIALVIVSSNQKSITAGTIELLKKQTLIPDIILVDNNSGDGTSEYLSEKFPDIVIIKSNKNYGGSGGQYLGCRYAFEKGYEWIILSDNDAIPQDSKLIEALVSRANFQTVTQPWNVDCDSDNFHSFWSMHYACYHRNVIQRIGYPNFNLFLYGDDVEFSLRIKDQFHIKKLTNIFYSHPQKKSYLPNLFYFTVRNGLFISARYDPWTKKFPAFILKMNAIFLYLYLGEFGFFKFGCKGVFYFFLNRFNNTIISQKSSIFKSTRTLSKKEFQKKYQKAFLNVDNFTYQKMFFLKNNFNFEGNTPGFRKTLLNYIEVIKKRYQVIIENSIVDYWNIPESILAKHAIFIDLIEAEESGNVSFREYFTGILFFKFLYLLVMNTLFVPGYVLILFKLYFIKSDIPQSEYFEKYIEKIVCGKIKHSPS